MRKYKVKCNKCNEYVISNHNGNIAKILCNNCLKCSICGLNHKIIPKYLSQKCSNSRKVQIYNKYRILGKISKSNGKLFAFEKASILTLNNLDSWAKFILKSNNKLPKIKCLKCNRKFYKKNSQQKICRKCQEIKRCKNCNLLFCNEIGKDNRSYLFCSRFCIVQYQHKNGYLNNKINNKSNNTGNIKINENFNQISIDNLIELNENNIKDYKLPGLWIKVVDNIIIDGMLTTNIYNEWFYINNRLKYKDTIKYKNMSKYIENSNSKELKFYLVELIENKDYVYSKEYLIKEAILFKDCKF